MDEEMLRQVRQTCCEGWDHCVRLLFKHGYDTGRFGALRHTPAWRAAEAAIDTAGRAGDIEGVKAGYRQCWRCVEEACG